MEDKIRKLVCNVLNVHPRESKNEVYNEMCRNLGFTTDIQRRLIEFALEDIGSTNESIGETSISEFLSLIKLTNEAQREAMEYMEEELRQIGNVEKQGASSPS